MKRTHADHVDSRLGGRVGRIHSTPTADVPNPLRINALWDRMTLWRADE
jgi:hypothetical protein